MKYVCARHSTERNMIIVILVCLLIGIAVIVSKKVFLDNYITDDIYEEDEETLWNFNDTDAKKIFMKLWMKANETLLARKVHLQDIQKGRSEDDQVQELAHCALILEYMKRSLQRCISLETMPEECKQFVRQSLNCSSESRYRTIDGSCNNLNHFEWGMSYINFNRWLKTTYADDVSLLRQSIHGVPLPPVRHLSVELFSRKILPDSNATMLFTHFGLFLDHDVVQVGQTRGNFSSCCEENERLRHPACLQIKNPLSDPVYGPANVTCKGFMRSPPAIGTCPGRREQQNRMTAFIDASDVYGPTDKETAKLRKYKRGLLRVNVVNNTPLLPANKHSGDTCYAKDGNYSCFISGNATFLFFILK
ncbi:chorion peroxidase [Nephila pilipes]|uniref:Chorion peroxidase n=1 Tax=Nephila pilipes TaxID=299642 RepID=A0A8X6I8U4_NEPPI|nr:chorion peroxidase [Nephila pilipes]